jgi:hypothetical protein
LSSATSQTSVASPRQAHTTAKGRRRRKALWVVAVAVLLVVAGAVVVVADPFSSKGNSRLGVVDNADPTSLATVNRQDLTSQTQVAATLGYAGSYTVVNQEVECACRLAARRQAGAPSATFTSLPAVGQQCQPRVKCFTR